MAGDRPGEGGDGGKGGVVPIRIRMRTKDDCPVNLFRVYDIPALTKMLDSLEPCSAEELQEAFEKNLKSFRRPDANLGYLYDSDNDDEEDEDEDEDGEEEDGEEDEGKEGGNDEENEDEDEEGEYRDILKTVADDKKRESDEQFQVPNDGEREGKKPRLAEASECKGGEMAAV